MGSNRRHHRFGPPVGVLAAALEELAALGTVLARSPVISTDPLGPAQRRFANAAALVESELDPQAMLAALQRLEREFGRRRWRRWGDRVLDCDIVLWDGGVWEGHDLTIPHPEFRLRDFVLAPAMSIAPQWHDPVSGLSISQLHARLTKPRPVLR
ncbi:2-amino-4-hydroxy-6-hydroxymethyldihydropteridine diphosphokinase [Erythrobacteraceae bacterium 1XM1-14]|uniref:2-amino-4-hydroxy-6-hydroxymethyldihydropteridine pyrophosphokinase n=1 Tax=Altererythrobacter litoralis TaxID=3113904 RepID=A0ABU7GHA7_9SPHN|nr:2-amino-4-hydroxy-6-hydroxymethyldihydropteridine diphosphokinase [Erythrobacteraceae bacterium 1XM1-14]